MKVICKKNYGSGGRLRKNNEYEVEIESCGNYKLKGVGGYWFMERFEILKKQTKYNFERKVI